MRLCVWNFNLLLAVVLPILCSMEPAVFEREIKSGWQLTRRPTPVFRSAAEQKEGLTNVAIRKRRASARASQRSKTASRCSPSAVDPRCFGPRGEELQQQRAAVVHEHSHCSRPCKGGAGSGGGDPPAGGCSAALGDRARLALSIAANPASWQRVLHGGETLLREEVTRALLTYRGEAAAFRYAACGLGDLMVKDKSGVHTAPKGCGHRLCPRCGRSKGRPMIKRIFAWLAAAPHGDIFTMCLTQRVDASETLPQARLRMLDKEHAYLEWLKDHGLISGASCAHPVWSVSSRGWHYHVHLVLECERGVWSVERLKALYHGVAADEQVQTDAKCASLVCTAGEPDGSLVGGSVQPDFFVESKSGLAAAVQYPIRDIAQGVSAKRLGADREAVGACVRVLLEHAKGWKLRRTFGQWRKKPPALPADSVPSAEVTAVDDAVKKKAAAICPGEPVVIFGTVHRCSRLAVAGSFLHRSLFVALELSCRNNTDFGVRFVQFCRAVEKHGSGRSENAVTVKLDASS